MKTIINLAAAAAILSLSVQASPVQNASAAPAQNASVSSFDMDTRVDNALQNLAAKVVARGGTRADYDALVAEFKAQMDAAAAINTKAPTLRTRFEASVADIQTRAATAAIAQEEFDLLRIEAIDARLDDALQALYARAVAGGATRQEYQRVANYLTAAADAAKAVDPDSGNIRTRLQSMVDALEKAAAKAASDFQPVAEEVTSARLGRNLTILSHRNDGKTLTATDWTRARNAINDAVDAFSKSDPTDAASIQKTLLASLDSLQKRAAAAGLTRADFDALRDSWTKRARAASAPK